MTCNLDRMLFEHERNLLNIAQTKTEGTPERAEWKRAAEWLRDFRDTHVNRCQKCISALRVAQKSSK